MSRKFYDLPPLSALASFEAAARHRSFKNAAEELNVTPGAVSRQIKVLETELRVALFKRLHRSVELTTEGRLLFGVINRSLTEISSVWRQLGRPDERQIVEIGATTAVASLWLTPRLSAFWREHGNIQVNQHVSDYPAHQRGRVALQIRYGKSDGTEQSHYELFRDMLIPVCSPDFAARHDIHELDQLAQLPLIHLDAEDANWTTWHTWFNKLGFHGPLGESNRVNNFNIALQAARDGVGVALGWRHLASPLIDSGSLVPLGPFSMEAPHSFHIETLPREALSPNALVLLDWLLDNTASDLT